MSATEVKDIREKLRLTQAELATQIGVTQTAISYWESGVRKPRGPALKLLSALAETSRRKK